MSDDLLALTTVSDVGIGGRNAAIDDVIARIAAASAARDRDGDPEGGLRADVRALASLA